MLRAFGKAPWRCVGALPQKKKPDPLAKIRHLDCDERRLFGDLVVCVVYCYAKVLGRTAILARLQAAAICKMKYMRLGS
jgi:hypothetical protein